MATIALAPVQLSWNDNGGSAEYEQLGISSGASPIAGDLCFKVNNTFDVCSTDPAQITYLIHVASGGLIPGDTRYQLLKIKPTEVYRMNAYHSTASLAVLADSALDAQSNYGVIKATVSGVTAWTMDLEETVAVRVRLIERLDSATDLYPRCRVQFLSSILTFA